MLSKAGKLQSLIPGIDDLLCNKSSLTSPEETTEKQSIVSALLSLQEGDCISDSVGKVSMKDGRIVLSLNEDIWYDSVQSLTGDADSAMDVVEYLQGRMSGLGESDKHNLLMYIRGGVQESEIKPSLKGILADLKGYLMQ
ncbi:hypothetical protein [Vibrio phage Va2]|nr:hypothetical protein [Vibrio phage Va2]